MPDNSEWDEALFRQSLAGMAARPPADAEELGRFMHYWTQSLDDAEASGAVTGVERDVLVADLQAAIRELPGVTVVEFSSGASLRLPFTRAEE